MEILCFYWWMINWLLMLVIVNWICAAACSFFFFFWLFGFVTLCHSVFMILSLVLYREEREKERERERERVEFVEITQIRIREYLFNCLFVLCWLVVGHNRDQVLVNLVCISYKTHSGSNKHGSISFMIDNMHYVNFRI